MMLSTAIVFVPVILFISFYCYFKLFSSRYWARRKIPHVEPKFLVGNLWKAGILENMMDILQRFYLENKEKKVLGYWTYTKPNLLVMDLDLIKRILVKDFNNFRDRGIELDTEHDPLAAHLFLMHGKEWRNLRVKLTPTFTSGKMKMMHPIMLQCGKNLEEFLKKPAKAKEVVEVKDLMARFTTDVISSCAFGIETNSIQNPDAEFRQWGKDIFKLNLKAAFSNVLLSLNPALMKLLKMRVVSENETNFFVKAVKDMVEYREKNNVKRNDFLQLLIQLIKVGKLEDADKTPVNGLDNEEIVRKFSLLEAAAQCFVFFIAGFETSSATLTFALYELALNPDIQAELQREIDAALDMNNNELNYDTLCEMEYLDKVVQESMRKYPPVGILQRKCINDYFVPELGITIEKDTLVVIPALGIHNDPDIYPNPNKFDPERFSSEERSKRHPFAFLPFGEGPRNCIGNRFGLMQVKIGITSVLRKFNIEVAKTTKIPVEKNIRAFVPVPEGGMPLVFTERV